MWGKTDKNWQHGKALMRKSMKNAEDVVDMARAVCVALVELPHHMNVPFGMTSQQPLCDIFAGGMHIRYKSSG